MENDDNRTLPECLELQKIQLRLTGIESLLIMLLDELIERGLVEAKEGEPE